MHKANESLGSPGAGNYQAARSATEGATTVARGRRERQPARRLPRAIQREARAVLDALPDEVNQGVLDALRDALCERRIRRGDVGGEHS